MNSVSDAISIFASAILLTLCMIACEGQIGPPGADAILADSLPPEIEWILPESGQLIDSTVTLSVKARDDQGLKQVIFYIAGFEYSGVLRDSVENRYEYLWNSLYWPEGPYPLMARAWDLERNSSRTPDVIVEVVHH